MNRRSFIKGLLSAATVALTAPKALAGPPARTNTGRMSRAAGGWHNQYAETTSFAEDGARKLRQVYEEASGFYDYAGHPSDIIKSRIPDADVARLIRQYPEAVLRELAARMAETL